MNTDQTHKLASITDAELLTFTESQFKAVVHMAKAVAELHGPHMTRHSSRVILEMQSVRANEIMEWLGDLLNGMDGFDDEDEGWMAPIFDDARRIYGECASALAREVRVEGGTKTPEERAELEAGFLQRISSENSELSQPDPQ